MSASINFHQRENQGGTISAHAHDYPNAPLCIEFAGADRRQIGSVAFFIDNDEYVRALVAAINAVKPAVRQIEEEA